MEPLQEVRCFAPRLNWAIAPKFFSQISPLKTSREITMDTAALIWLDISTLVYQNSSNKNVALDYLLYAYNIYIYWRQYWKC
jgi:hypothetical protein